MTAVAYYIVQPGDTLSAIARRELGEARQWRHIYAANTGEAARRNKVRPLNDPNRIFSGERLAIPGKGKTGAAVSGSGQPAAPMTPLSPMPASRRRDVIIYLYGPKTSAARSAKTRHKHFEERGDLIHLEYGNQSISVGEIVREMVSVTEQDGLHLVMVHAHGNSAFTAIGTGITKANAGMFQPLRPLFQRSGLPLGIEFHSCCFASAVSTRPRFSKDVIDAMDMVSSTCHRLSFETLCVKLASIEYYEHRWSAWRKDIGKGTDMLKAVASAIGAPAKGACGYQLADRSGFFEGPWACAWPDGRVKFFREHVPPGSIR